ncbi:hypothetical protein B5F86_02370 [Lachnoclostridium sp. An298]|nr:hypothetical protein B5F86_02370 [Lachnoclostridium sp. An298]
MADTAFNIPETKRKRFVNKTGLSLYRQTEIKLILKKEGAKQMAKSKLVKANQKIADSAAGGYKKIERGVVGGYKKIENGEGGGIEIIRIGTGQNAIGDVVKPHFTTSPIFNIAQLSYTAVSPYPPSQGTDR